MKAMGEDSAAASTLALEQSSEVEARLLALVSALENPGHRRARNNWLFFIDRAGEWQWTNRDTNGQVVGASHEGFKNRSACDSNAARNGWDEAQKTAVEEKPVEEKAD